MPHFRHEIKYICSPAELEEIRLRMDTIGHLDAHAKEGKYLIRSIYFDDYYNSAYYDNESGVDYREKWRIRSYDLDSEFIRLECKKKQAGMINKTSCQISRERLERLLVGDISHNFGECESSLLNRFYYLCETRLLKPVVIVQYQRVPYIYEEGNVRVTFDCDIASSTEFHNFFDESMNTRAIQEENRQLLEIKFDEFLPNEIYKAVQLKNMQQQTFSKYYLCRKFGLEN